MRVLGIMFLLSGAVALAFACEDDPIEESEELIDCGNACEDWEDCAGDDFNVSECVDRCEDRVDDMSEARVERCRDCLDANERTCSVCVEACSGIVP